MAEMIDIFRGDAFGIVPLTMFINNLKFVPGYVSGQGIFTESGVTTTAIAIEEKNHVLSLVSPTARGGPGQTLNKPRRGMRMLGVPHFEINDAIMAEEVQGVRAFGQETGTETVMMKVGERLQTHGQSLEYTQEYSRVGAIKGVITYGDGTQLDLYKEYGINTPAPIDFNLDSTTSTGALRQKCAALFRTVGANLDGIPFTGIEALVGDQFFDALIMHLGRNDGRARIAVWEHNSHLGDARATDMRQRSELNVGQLTREKYGHDAVLIGFTTHHGTVTAASDWGAPAERKRVRPALAGSYEALFHAAERVRFLLTWRDNDTLAVGLREPRLERAIGVIYRPETERQSHYFRARLPDQFDAVLHYDETRAVKPLEVTTEWEAGEVPETFPFAV